MSDTEQENRAGKPAEQHEASGAPGDAAGAEASASRQASGADAEIRAELKKLQVELESKNRRIDEVTRAYSAMVNDQKEFRGRLEREKDRVLENERGNVALVLLETADELDRALSASKEEGGPLAEGVRLVREGLMQRLHRMGIERLSLVGTPFDPNLAEAIDLELVAEPEKADLVLAEAVPGYRLGSRLIRPAKVKVARYLPEAKPESSAENQTPQA